MTNAEKRAAKRIADLEAELAMERGAIKNRDEAYSQMNASWGVEYRKEKARVEKAEAEVERLKESLRYHDCPDGFERGGRESGDQGPGSVPGRPGRPAAAEPAAPCPGCQHPVSMHFMDGCHWKDSGKRCSCFLSRAQAKIEAAARKEA